MHPKNRMKATNRISGINRSRLGYLNGKLFYRDLTEEEALELKKLHKSLEPQFTDREVSLFSEIVEENGGTVFVETPQDKAAIAAIRSPAKKSTLGISKKALKAILDRIDGKSVDLLGTAYLGGNYASA